MLNTQMRRWLGRMSVQPSPKRRRTHRQALLFNPPAEISEVLEDRLLLTVTPAGTPFAVFAVQPSNAEAGHALSFTLDVMIQPKGSKSAIIDTAFSGGYFVTPTQPGVYFASTYNSTIFPPNTPIAGAVVGIVKGVGPILPNIAAIDQTGTYTLTASEILGAPPEGVLPNIVSKPFTITPFTATDHLVFAPAFAFAGFPTRLSVSVEDQYRNVDTNVSNVQLSLLTFPGTPATATLVNGQATFNNVVFTSAGQDVVLAIGFGGPNGVLVGYEIVPVVALNNGG
jgi:hypothetical protein